MKRIVVMALCLASGLGFLSSCSNPFGKEKNRAPETDLLIFEVEGNVLDAMWEGSDDGEVANYEYRYQGSGAQSQWISVDVATLHVGDIPPGVYLFEVRAVDDAGKVDATPARAAFAVGGRLPETEIVSSEVADTGFVAIWQGIAGDADVAHFDYRYQGSGSIAWTRTDTTALSIPLTDGAYTFQVRAVDEEGKTDETPATVSFLIQREMAAAIDTLEADIDRLREDMLAGAGPRITQDFTSEGVPEVTIPGELTLIVPPGAVSQDEYPDGITAEIRRVTPEESLEAYAAISPLSPIYRLDAGNAEFAEPITLRIPVDNIHVPEGLALEDLQIVTWQDPGIYQFLPTTIGPGGEWLEVAVAHFSFFTVQVRPTKNLFSGAELQITGALEVAAEGDALAFDALLSDSDADVLDWLRTPSGNPQMVWVNYRVAMVPDGETQPVRAMHVYRTAWYPGHSYDARWINPEYERTSSLRRTAFRLEHRASLNDEVMGKEVIVLFDAEGFPIDIQETTLSVAEPAGRAGDFLYQVFDSQHTRRFVELAVLADPEVDFRLQITRGYDDWQYGKTETATSGVFSSYDIPPSVTLVEPEDAASGEEFYPSFSWQSEAMPGVTVHHELLIGTDPDPRTDPDHTVATEADDEFINGIDEPAPLLLDPDVYYWCVRAFNHDGVAARAEVHSETRMLTVVHPNRAPAHPGSPTGPPSGNPVAAYSFSATATDADGDRVSFMFDWGDGAFSEWSAWVESGSPASMSHAWSELGDYLVRVKTRDESEQLESDWSDQASITKAEPNTPPNTPALPTGIAGEDYSFSTNTTDPDGDEVSYMFDWGDGTVSDWSEFIAGGESVSVSHTWASPGTYLVKVKARDTRGGESAWSDFTTITIDGGPSGS